eukprot:gene25511-biopygen22497
MSKPCLHPDVMLQAHITETPDFGGKHRYVGKGAPRPGERHTQQRQGARRETRLAQEGSPQQRALYMTRVRKDAGPWQLVKYE